MPLLIWKRANSSNAIASRASTACCHATKNERHQPSHSYVVVASLIIVSATAV
uniref:Uncharacterized protein n=1 Tax=Arundo donax TaxID=35708 RepID=A0A0A8ZVR1_ARUDO